MLSRRFRGPLFCGFCGGAFLTPELHLPGGEVLTHYPARLVIDR